MTIVLDAGALIAVDRRDRRVGAMLRVAHHEGSELRTSAAVVAQVWRNGPRQANLARVLAGVDTVALDGFGGRRIGELLRATRSTDVVDGHVALLVRPGDLVLTSDPDELRVLLGARDVDGRVVVV